MKKIHFKSFVLTLFFLNISCSAQQKKVVVQNSIETKNLKIVMQLNSIEGIKTAVSLGLGAAFVSSSAIEKEVELEKIVVIKIDNVKITRSLSIISNPECYKSKSFELFYKELFSLKNKTIVNKAT